ncbi:hypothetical protein [Roseovarius sp. D0-M9]|uniref:hypothetical protein n=1 Tax=Roseovarius sp. D0-M9 TaxID=3127117 RepID=UPI00300FAFF7
MKNQNRATIRKMRRDADKIAAVLAANTLEADGRAGVVVNPTARKVLARGYADLIRNGCKPVVQRITETEAASLPGYRPTPPGATWWAAFGLDVDGRGTWVSRWAQVRGLPPEEARDAVEVRLLADLGRACNASGFPVMEGQR